MKFPTDFKKKVNRAIRLLGEANKAMKTGDHVVARVCAYNSAVVELQQLYGGEWWIFRNKAFAGGATNDGVMDANGGAFNPFREDVPRKKKLSVDTNRLCAAQA